MEEVLAILASFQNFGLRKPKFCQRISHYYCKSFSEFWASLPCSACLDLDKSKAHSFLSIIFKQRTSCAFLCLIAVRRGVWLRSCFIDWTKTEKQVSGKAGAKFFEDLIFCEGENETWSFIPLSFDPQSNRRALPTIESRYNLKIPKPTLEHLFPTAVGVGDGSPKAGRGENWKLISQFQTQTTVCPRR